MEFPKKELVLDPEEPVHIIPFSDVHLDSRDCDREGWKSDYKRAAKLHNARFLNLGDFNNLVLPSDLKRHTPETPDQRYSAVDYYINLCLQDTEEALDTVPGAVWDLWCMGNHEQAALKHHHFNLPMEIARRRNLSYGTYSGRLWYQVKRKGSNSGGTTFRILYHHGAWTSQATKGVPPSAQRFASRMGGWHIFVYGHNHQENVSPDQYWDVADRGNETIFKRHYVNTGTYLKTLSRHGESPDYAEIRGYPITTIGVPIIKLWYDRNQKGGRDVISLQWDVISHGGVTRKGGGCA